MLVTSGRMRRDAIVATRYGDEDQRRPCRTEIKALQNRFFLPTSDKEDYNNGQRYSFFSNIQPILKKKIKEFSPFI